MRFLLFMALLAVAVLSAGCGGGSGEETASGSPMGLVTVVPREQPDYVPPPTATSWPTFTPVPPPAPTVAPDLRSIPGTPTPELRYPGGPPGLTPTPAATVVAGVAATSVAVSSTPVAAPAPSPSVAADGGGGVLEPTPAPTPGPTPYGRIPDGESGEARFIEQSLFPLMLPEVATSLLDDFPPSTGFISRDARFVVWAVRYDMSYVSEDFALDGFVQWWDMGPPEDNAPFVMLEEPVSITKTAFQFHHGIGRQTPGFWQPGLYRVAFLDAGHNEVVSWDFEVR